MRWLLTMAVLSLLVLSVSGPLPAAAENMTRHSFVFLNGYMDETSIYQTDSGYAGQKLVVGTRGSGMVSRRQSVDVYHNWKNDGDYMDFNEWGVFQYKPYRQEATESDLKNALCAKNYEVGSVFSESYSDIQQLVKDTTIYQDDNVSLYQMDSYIHGTAKVGARYQEGPGKVPIMINGGVYVGEVKIRDEYIIGDGAPFVLPCP